MGRKLLRITIWLLATLLLLFTAGEITVRLMGHRAWSPDTRNTKIEPGGSLFVADDTLGFKLRPGKFSVTLNDQLTFTATHDENGHRFIPSINDTTSKPEIWIFGCSFTYGWGVNDNECWPAILADSLPQFRIVNFATPAYGTLHAWYQYQREEHKGKKPAVVIVAYGAFHNQRNVCSRHWKKALAGQQVMEGIQYPFLKQTPQGIETQFSDLKYEPWLMSQYSAFIHFFEKKSNEAEEEGLHAREVSREELLKIANRARTSETTFVLAGIWRDAETTETLNYFQRMKVNTIDISNPQEEQYFIQPGDMHPNAKAHVEMAQNMLGFFLRVNLK
jgi:hypothetical protein